MQRFLFSAKLLYVEKPDKNTKAYKIIVGLLKPLYILLFHPKIVNSNYIPVDGPAVIAGNHTHIMDPGCVIISTKRQIHYLAKEFLFDYKIVGPLFEKFGCIKVLKDKSNHEALVEAINELKNGKIIGIFPEGKVKTEHVILEPFKFGAVKMAKEADCPIIPFAISGKFIPFISNVKIVYGKPIDISNLSLEEANNLLYKTVKDLIINNK